MRALSMGHFVITLVRGVDDPVGVGCVPVGNRRPVFCSHDIATRGASCRCLDRRLPAAIRLLMTMSMSASCCTLLLGGVARNASILRPLISHLGLVPGALVRFHWLVLDGERGSWITRLRMMPNMLRAVSDAHRGVRVHLVEAVVWRCRSELVRVLGRNRHVRVVGACIRRVLDRGRC